MNTCVDACAGPLDPASQLRRIKDIARVLDNFAQLREPGRPRADYLEQVPWESPCIAGCNFYMAVHGRWVLASSTCKCRGFRSLQCLVGNQCSSYIPLS